MTTKAKPRSSGSPAPTRAGRKRLGIVAERARDAIGRGISSGRTLVAHVPATVRTTQARANAATSALQTLPDSTLRGLAGSSVGLAAGFYLARVPRVLTAAAVAPAMVMGWAILVRPRDRDATEFETSQRAGAAR
jgi:hypothetical protein